VSAASLQSEAQASHPVIQRFFEVSLYFMLFTGFAMLAGTGKLDVASVGLGLFALLVKGYLLIRKSHVLIPEQWTTYLTLIYLFFFALDYFLLSRSFLGAIVHMVLFAAMVKVFSVHRDRDYVYLAVLSFGMVLTAAVLTVDSLFFAIFCIFVLLAVMTFVSMEMRRAWIAGHRNQTGYSPSTRNLSRLPASIAGACALLVVTIVFGTIALFFLVPRKATAGYLSAFASRNELSTGFSEEVRLGQVGEIQQSDQVLMHVKFASGVRVPSDLHWRGIALANFDGRSWTSLHEHTLVASPNGVLPAMERLRSEPGAETERLAYDVSLEPFGSRVFFVLPDALIINGRYKMVSVDSTGTIFNEDSARPITEYSAVSQLPARVPPDLNAVEDPGLDPVYVRSPTYLDARIAALAERISADQSTPLLKASAIERYLSTNYGYTLQLPSAVPKDPIGYFLFTRKMGHCEYFASSMAVMLRTIGIPSRVVNGFRGGEYNDITGSYIIRAKDAHSWVEAYIPGYGWRAFDPTPSSPVESSKWNRAYLYADAMREFWHNWVVEYDSGHQTSLAISAVRQGHSSFERLRDWTNSAYDKGVAFASGLRESFQRRALRWLLLGGSIIAIVLLLVGGPAIYRSIRRVRLTRKPSLQPNAAATIWYERALKLLAKRGWRKGGSQTPQEFLNRVPSAVLRSKIETFTSHYESARFGESVADAEKLPGLYREIEEAVKK
jgi:protein-glutamine gamma-glutamyltransferase